MDRYSIQYFHLRSAKVSSGFIAALMVILSLVAAVASILFRDTSGRSGSGLSDAYDYDLTAYLKIDPSLIVYEQVLAFDTELLSANAVTIHGEELYLAGDAQIRIFDLSGRKKQDLALDAPPWCLDVDRDGSIWIGFLDRVEQYSREGKRLSAWASLGPKAKLTSIVVARDDVFVADAGNRIVLRYDRSGTLKNEIGRKNDARQIAGFVIPSPHFDLAIGPDGLLRVVNPGRHFIEAYTFRGDREFDWGKAGLTVEGFSGCCNPVNFAILPDGSFITVEKGIVRVKVYDAQGQFVGVVAGPEHLLDSPAAGTTLDEVFDVAVDSRGRVYILDPLKNQIRVFRKSEKKP